MQNTATAERTRYRGFGFVLVAAALLGNAACDRPVPPPGSQPPPGGGSPRDRYGVGAYHTDDRTLRQVYESIGAAGVRWMRDDFDRQTINPRRGEYDWSAPDALVAEAARNGIEVLGVLCCTPQWDAVSPAPPSDIFFTSPPRDYELWGDYVFRTVSRYKDRVHYWEVWNEPDFARPTGDWAGTPEEYWEQFSEVAAPFRPLLAQLTPERKTAAVEEILAALKKFWNGRELNMPLEIVIGTGMRP